ncbi:hypothetical protein T459_26155 [Capsicum annuum]|uniref:PPM-type phosphatase domain-containing protein n=1 Tax=Capsicum annuum TaxID=4072 RepID=A0A2G2YN82_CAPAN|nr:hypothetical protein T459_26155 [Capsicum annuum]
MLNALLISSGLPQNLWGEAILTTNCILNRVPHSKTQSIPYEKWKERKLNLKYFKVWECLAKVQVPMPKRVKIGPKTVDCVFIGYAKSSKALAPVCIHCDSQASIGRAGSMMYNGKYRHIRRRHNTIRELLSSGIITVDYVKSKDNMSDPLTKGLSREGVERTSKGMDLRPRTSQHGGKNLVIGNIGDSRAVLAMRGEDDSFTAVQLIVDLKPDLPAFAIFGIVDDVGCFKDSWLMFGTMDVLDLIMCLDVSMFGITDV